MKLPEQETEILRGMGELGKSRSQKKRESTALQQMGEALSSLASSQLELLGLPQDLLEAIQGLQPLKKREAKRRQQQLIGRYMRELDEEASARIRQFLRNMDCQHQAEIGNFHQLEAWRESLLDEYSREKALAEVQGAKPSAEVKKLRHLATSAVAERKNSKNSKSYRELFRYLKGL